MPVDPVFSWSGAYVGVQAGYGWGREHDNQSDQFPDGPDLPPIFESRVADKFDMDGAVGGIYAGYNWQTPSNWVFGVEGDFQFSGLDGSHDYQDAFFSDPFFTTTQGTLSMDSDWQASLRARAGYAVDRNLFYVTGGIAFADAELRDEGTATTGGRVIGGEVGLVIPEPGETISYDNSDSHTLVGYAVGLGIEHAFTDNLIGRVEGRYMDFGSHEFELGDYDVDADFNIGQVTVGIAYKF